MTDLDDMLDALRASPIDPRLQALAPSVLDGVARRRNRIAVRRSLLVAGFIALGTGWIGSMVPATPASASPVAIGMSDYAPSRLLGR
ncbi:hypothetical protein [Sphingobium naphthae]|uniref:DUF3040 domain-containing protein n=1 Tax=Sphingobium naphthae TaxID=1886786 RepID=A0ABU4A1N4_9SPHN|nr:hypothetical protein [Sphingobium naphthae]MDV5825655.1 hypothetical protein [Sphingobium naphthae]